MCSVEHTSTKKYFKYRNWECTLNGGVAESGGSALLLFFSANENRSYMAHAKGHLRPCAPGGLKVHPAHFAVGKHFVSLCRIELFTAVSNHTSHVTCMSDGRSSSVSSAPHPPTLSALAGGLRAAENAAAPPPLPVATLADAPATDAPSAMACHAGGAPKGQMRGV